MEKHKVLACYGMLILTLGLILSLGLASANTLVGGKIYLNSMGGSVVEGADVYVQCGSNADSDTKNTISLSDGTYAITFDTDDCYKASTVKVTAFQGNLEGGDPSSEISNSQEEGDYVAVANVHIQAPVSVNPKIRRGGSGGFFLCGNTVCDSGETHETCASDCPLVQEPLVAPLNPEDSGNTGNDNQPNTETQTVQNTSTIPGITGAVTGSGDDGDNNTWLLIVGIIMILGILIAITSLIRGNIKRKKMGYN